MESTTHRRPPPLGVVTDETLTRAGIERRHVDVVNGFLEVMRAMSVRLESVAAELGVNGPTLLALFQLDEPRSQKHIAATLGCDPSYVTTIVDRLEELGAAERVTSTADRRVKLVTLTPAGHELRQDANVRLLAQVPATLGLDDGEVELLAGLLAALVRANAEVLADDDPFGVAG